jgi:hypothetical protein
LSPSFFDKLNYFRHTARNIKQNYDCQVYFLIWHWHFGNKASYAPGIAAESPQELRGQFRGLGAESPVFLPARAGKKRRPNSSPAE